MAYQNLNYAQIRELDLESEKKLTDDPGPADECICDILAPPTPKKGMGGQMRDSFKRVMRSVSGSGKRRQHYTGAGGGGGAGGGNAGLTVPLTSKPQAGGFFTRKETVKRTKPCGRACGCNENFTMKHTEAVVKIITPDISNICPCPTNCIPGADKLNHVSVVVEHMHLKSRNLDTSDSEASVDAEPTKLTEPTMQRNSISDLIEAEYEEETEDEELKEDDTPATKIQDAKTDEKRMSDEKTRHAFMDGKADNEFVMAKVVNGDDDDDSDWSFGIDDGDPKVNQDSAVK